MTPVVAGFLPKCRHGLADNTEKSINFALAPVTGFSVSVCAYRCGRTGTKAQGTMLPLPRHDATPLNKEKANDGDADMLSVGH